MLDLVSAIRMPTMKEVIDLRNICQFGPQPLTDGGMYTYCSWGDTPAIISTDPSYPNPIAVSDTSETVKYAGVRAVFELQFRYINLIPTGTMVYIGSLTGPSGVSKDSAYTWSEPKQSGSIIAVCVAPGILITHDILRSWMPYDLCEKFYTLPDKIPFVACPTCGTLHRMPQDTGTIVCCSNCLSRFTASHIEPTGIHVYYSPEGFNAGIVTSMGAPIPMEGGCPANTIMCGKPVYIPDYITVKMMAESALSPDTPFREILRANCGDGFDRVNKEQLLEQLQHSNFDLSGEEIAEFVNTYLKEW